jgi:hypothetical protein
LSLSAAVNLLLYSKHCSTRWLSLSLCCSCMLTWLPS